MHPVRALRCTNMIRLDLTPDLAQHTQVAVSAFNCFPCEPVHVISYIPVPARIAAPPCATPVEGS